MPAVSSSLPLPPLEERRGTPLEDRQGTPPGGPVSLWPEIDDAAASDEEGVSMEGDDSFSQNALGRVLAHELPGYFDDCPILDFRLRKQVSILPVWHHVAQRPADRHHVGPGLLRRGLPPSRYGTNLVGSEYSPDRLYCD